MWEYDDFDGEATGVVFRDILMLALMAFVAMVIIMIAHLNPSETQADDNVSPGNVVVEIHWPDSMAVDVDLWVQAPDDVPVGFFNQGGRFFNLLRDDRGAEGDASSRNYEVSYSRGISSGEYTVNVHMYGALLDDQPVPVNVIVSVRPEDDHLRQILQRTVTLYRRNQEETAFRFEMSADGQLDRSSVTTLRRRLVTAPSMHDGTTLWAS